MSEGGPNGFGKCVPNWQACNQYGAQMTEINVLSLYRKQSVKRTEANARAWMKCSQNMKFVARGRKEHGR